MIKLLLGFYSSILVFLDAINELNYFSGILNFKFYEKCSLCWSQNTFIQWRIQTFHSFLKNSRNFKLATIKYNYQTLYTQSNINSRRNRTSIPKTRGTNFAKFCSRHFQTIALVTFTRDNIESHRTTTENFSSRDERRGSSLPQMSATKLPTGAESLCPRDTR